MCTDRYIQGNPTGPGYTSDQQFQHSQQAVVQNEPIYGPSWLSFILNYGVIQGNGIDYMHCVLLGVTKMLLNMQMKTMVLWTKDTRSRQQVYFKSIHLK